jgi:carboxyl-terminal processing protease
MCALLDGYSGYNPYGTTGAPPQPDKASEHFAGQKRLYIKIYEFIYGVDNEVISLLKNNPGKPLLLDLSDCSGGATAVMEKIANAIVPDGLIYAAKFRDGERQFYSCPGGAARRPILVITGLDTASCAEILAAALKESGAAIIVGERTFGKASIQNMRVLPNGGMLKITVGHWLTRNGADIGGTGVTPDITLNRGCVSIIRQAWGDPGGRR